MRASLPRAWRTTLLSLLLTGSFLPVAQAINEPAFDLDSLVYQADQIVEGQITQVDKVGWELYARVKISSVEFGNLTPGSIITVSVTGYRRETYSNDGLQAGDQLVLFLTGVNPERLNYLKRNGFPPPDFDIISSGIKLIVDNQAYGFEQGIGPYEAMRSHNQPGGSTSPGGPLLSVPQLREAIAASEAKAAAWHAWFATKPTPLEIPRLLALLQERANILPQGAIPFLEEDVISAAARQRLAQIGDLPALYQAFQLRLNATLGWDLALPDNFDNPAGQQFLLHIINDATESRDERIELAKAWLRSSAMHYNDWDNRDSPHGMAANTTSQDQSLLAPVAQLAVQNAADPPLCCAYLNLLQALLFHTLPAAPASPITEKLVYSRGGYQENAQPLPPTTAADRAAALKLLEQFAKTADNEDERYVIARAQTGTAEFTQRQIDAIEGAIACRLVTSHSPPPAPQNYMCDYSLYWTTAATSVTSAALVFEAVPSHQTYTVDVSDQFVDQLHVAAGSHMTSSVIVDRPAKLPHGQYKVSLRFMAGDVLAAKSTTLEATL